MRLDLSSRFWCHATRRWVALLFVCCLCTGWFHGCRTVGITGRQQFVPMSESQLNEMGLQGYQQILQDAKISTNAQYTSMVKTVGARIAAVADRWLEKEGREPFDWEFTVVEASDTVNAFALPGGKVAFYTGILPVCQDETGVAVVMGHEVAHAFAMHGGERVAREAVGQYGLQAVLIALSGTEASETSQVAIAALGGAGLQYGVSLPFSRRDESEADQIGLHFMAEAGYDPREAARFWGRMAKLSAGATAEFFSTHPSHDTRIAQINGWLPDVLPKYEAAQRR